MPFIELSDADKKNEVRGAKAFDELLDLLVNRFSSVRQVYRGKSECCRCGCKGDYATMEAVPDLVKRRLMEMVKLSGAGRDSQGYDGLAGERLINVDYGRGNALTVYFERVKA